MNRYNFKTVEAKWQKNWQGQKHFVTKITSALEQELQVAILKKAVLFEKEFNKNKKKFKRSDIK